MRPDYTIRRTNEPSKLEKRVWFIVGIMIVLVIFLWVMATNWPMPGDRSYVYRGNEIGVN